MIRGVFLLLVVLLSSAAACMSKGERAKHELRDVRNAVIQFVGEYGYLPIYTAQSEASEAEMEVALKTLCGRDQVMNPRSIVFLEMEFEDPLTRYLDPWETPVRVYTDHDQDGIVSLYGKDFETWVIVHSAGADRTWKTADDQFTKPAGGFDLAPVTFRFPDARELRADEAFFLFLLLSAIFSALCVTWGRPVGVTCRAVVIAVLIWVLISVLYAPLAPRYLGC